LFFAWIVFLFLVFFFFFFGSPLGLGERLSERLPMRGMSSQPAKRKTQDNAQGAASTQFKWKMSGGVWQVVWVFRT
jgi:hypothetical protein